MTKEEKQEIKKMSAEDLANDVVFYTLFSGDEEMIEALLKQLGIVLRSIENNIYWATTDSGYTEEQKMTILDIERERLLDIADTLDPDGE
jgi:hypothetical protein